MLIISHRGNLTGPEPEKENSPEFIEAAIDNGYHCEIDVWLINDKLLLGHDYPKYEVNEKFLFKEELWCHAKNLDALHFMLSNQIHCFWHEDDTQTITSKGYIWTHEKSKIYTPKSVACWINADKPMPVGAYGICTDFVNKVIS